MAMGQETDENGEPLFVDVQDGTEQVRVGTDEELADAPGERLEIVDSDGNRVRYQVEYDTEYALDKEKVQYLIRPL